MEELLRYLSKFNYKFLNEKDLITIYLDKSFIIKVRHDQDVYKIEETTINFSFLTGVISMNLRNTLVFNTVVIYSLFILFPLSLIYEELSRMIYPVIIYLALYFSWFFYYLIRSELFKMKIEKILNEKG
ncbi:MAG: hypothetical protein ABS44_06335 [Chryseobacterium sp. SCN 40-13]|nr:MAG: hypothetical protein ABS44_06335 [Chryseobacterium sp. SCN 40-13]